MYQENSKYENTYEQMLMIKTHKSLIQFIKTSFCKYSKQSLLLQTQSVLQANQ